MLQWCLATRPLWWVLLCCLMCSGAVAAALLSSWGGLALSTTVLAAPVLISEWNDERLGGALTVLHGTAAAGALLTAGPMLSEQKGTHTALQLSRTIASVLLLVSFRGLELLTGLRVGFVGVSVNWVMQQLWKRLLVPLGHAASRVVTVIQWFTWTWKHVGLPLGRVMRRVIAVTAQGIVWLVRRVFWCSRKLADGITWLLQHLWKFALDL